MADQRWVLVHVDSGQEFVFTSRSEYVNTKACGGYRDKPAEREPAGPSPAPRQVDRPTPRREPVNDEPTVEFPTAQ